MIGVGSQVRVVDGIPQHYAQKDIFFRQIESHILSCYAGKIGTVCFIDGCEEMPFIVSFEPEARVPFGTFRFRPEEVGELG